MNRYRAAREGLGLFSTTRKLLLLLICSTVFLISGNVNAASCSGIFSSGAQSHSASGYLEMDWQSRISGGGTSLKVPSIIDNTGWASCQTAACSAAGTYNSVVNYTIPASSGADGSISVGYQGNLNKGAGNYTTVNVGQSGTLRFTTNNGQYYTNGFTTNYQSVLNLSPGDYYINGNLVIAQETVINISGSGPARLFVNGTVSFGFRASSGNSNPANLLIYAKNSVSLDNEVDLKAFVYSQTGGVTMNFRSKITGGVSAAGRIYLDNESTITYSSSASTADFGTLCNGSAPSINSFNIDVGGGSASTCSAKSITITARDTSNAKLTAYTGTVTITTSTSRGTWAKTGVSADAYGTLTPGSDNGQASYTFTSSDAGDIVLNLTNPRAQSLTITVADSSAGKSSTSSTLTFSENAFVISTASDSLGNDVVAGRDHTLTATMMRRDPVTGNCGAATGYNISGQKMWLTRHANDPAGAAPTAIGASSVSLPNSQPASNNINLSFSNGVANFSLRTTDVGKYAINIADTSNSFASSTISGSSSTLVVRPFGIRVGVTGNPAASSATGTKFRAAGQTFTLTVTAVGWQSLDDANVDGIPDAHDDNSPANNANLTDNSPLISYGKESPAEGISVSAVLNAPAGGTNGGLSGSLNFSSFTTGAASSSTISYSEVGIIEIGAVVTDGDYMGSTGSAKIIGKSGYVGRFYPDHFRMTGLSVTPTCSAVLPYSYLGEDFTAGATVTPYNFAGIALQNYKSGFNKIDTTLIQTMLSAVDEASSTNLTSRLVSSAGIYSWSNGILTAVPAVKLNRGTSPDGPFSSVRLGFKPVDTDGVTLRASDLNLDINADGAADTARVGNTQGIRFGRLRLDDSYGPETDNLPVIFRTEYWDGSSWKQNLDDSCTTIALNRIQYPAGPINVVANRSPAVGSGTTTGEYAVLNPSSIGFLEGDAGHRFTAPGAGNTGTVSVQVDLTDYPWLRYDWNGDADFSDSSLPTARFTFGSYRGHDRVLYWIESNR